MGRGWYEGRDFCFHGPPELPSMPKQGWSGVCAVCLVPAFNTMRTMECLYRLAFIHESWGFPGWMVRRIGL